MLTKLIIRNFKLLDDVEIELGNPVVFIGPNNSGKTTALQALALWDVGVRRWNEKRDSSWSEGKKRIGVAINRKDLVSIPVPLTNLLWRDLHTRNVIRKTNGQSTENVCVEIQVEGVSKEGMWTCGLEFDYANAESFCVRPLRTTPKGAERTPVPPEAAQTRVAFLPLMSGLAVTEYLKQKGEIDVLIGQGQSAEVLRNLCYGIFKSNDVENQNNTWRELVDKIRSFFGIELQPPEFIAERGEITLTYRDVQGALLDISSAGRGLRQTLLLLAHILSNPGTVLLIDEPDAHLEILRQRQTYQLINEFARRYDCQLVCASHSEVVLQEAAGRDIMVAFVGKPHRIDARTSQLLKSFREIGFQDYYLAEQKG